MYSMKHILLYACVAFCMLQITWARVGDLCTSSCEGNMLCKNGKCACPADNVETPDKTRCLPVATGVGGGCELQTQCTQKLSEYAICLDYKCTCKENAAVVGNVCEKRRALGETCNMMEQCRHIINAECSGGVCACNQQNVPSANDFYKCLEIATVANYPCEEDIQCSRGLGDSSICQDSTCQCRADFHFFQSFKVECVRNKGLSEQCNKGECFLPMDEQHQNIECSNGECSCIGDIKPSKDNQSCSGSAGLRSLGLMSAVWLIVLGFSRSTA